MAHVPSDDLWMHLYTSSPADGFDELEPGRYRRAVQAAECDVLLYVTVVCEWRGAPFQIQDEADGELLLEYLGGLVPVALGLRLERIDRGIYRTWAPRSEVRTMRENAVVLSQ
jgi:hypothetical protein